MTSGNISASGPVSHKKSSLAATALEEFWGDNPHKLVLWPAAIRFRDINANEAETFDLKPNLLERSGDNPHQAAHEYCRELSARLFAAMVPILNDIHNTNYSEVFWLPLIRYFLYKFVSVSYEKFLALENYCDPADVDITILLPGDYYIPKSHTDFAHFCTTDYGVLQMTSAYFSSQTDIEVSYHSGTYEPPLPGKPKGVIRALKDGSILDKVLLRASHWRHRNIEPTALLHGAYFAPSVVNKLILGSSGKIRRVPQEDQKFSSPWAIDSQMRAQLDNLIPIEDDFTRYLNALLPSLFPRTYFEGFNEMEIASKNILDMNPQVKHIISENWLINDASQFIIAQMKARGGHHIHPQHGYQYMNSTNFNWVAEEVSDYFVSTGWIDPLGSEKIVSGGSGKYIRERSPSGNETILYVSGAAWIYPPMIYDLLWGPFWELYQLKQKAFFDQLTPAVASRTLYRSHRDFGWPLSNPSRCSDRPSANKVSLESAMASAGITVIDHLSTPLMDVLLMGVPFLVIVDQDLYPPAPGFEDHFTELASAGVAHSSFEDAADYLAQMGTDYVSWWKSKEVATAVANYRSKNLRSSDQLIKSLMEITGLGA